MHIFPPPYTSRLTTSSRSPTPLDAHLSALLSLMLFIPLPTPLLGDLINASFPRLWTHTNLLRRTLWSSERPSPIHASAASTSISWRSTLRDFTPELLATPPWEWWGEAASGTVRGGGKTKKRTKAEEEFATKRWWFAGVVVVGILGWGVGTGAIPLPGRPGIWGGDDEEEEEEGEWETVE